MSEQCWGIFNQWDRYITGFGLAFIYATELRCVKNERFVLKKARNKSPQLTARRRNCLTETYVTCVTVVLGLCHCSYVSWSFGRWSSWAVRRWCQVKLWLCWQTSIQRTERNSLLIFSFAIQLRFGSGDNNIVIFCLHTGRSRCKIIIILFEHELHIMTCPLCSLLWLTGSVYWC